MKRSQIMLSGLGAVLLIALFFVLLYQPNREAVAETEERIAAEQQTQQELQTEINRLRSVRDEAPEVEAQLAAAEAIVPRDPGLPSALRQLQLAADESGLILATVSTARPVPVDGGPDDLSLITINAQLQGGYFQIVDFLRRVEDPGITPRGLLWTSLGANIDEYPELNVTLAGELYAMLESPVPDELETEPETDDAEGDDATDGQDDGLEDENLDDEELS